MSFVTESALLVGIAGVFTTMLGWVGVRIHNRVDKLEEQVAKTVTREELDSSFTQLREENRQAHQATAARLDQIWKHLADNSKE